MSPSPPDPETPSPESLSDRIERLPDAPGVYLMKDRRGKILYIGKAKRLRQRVRQYFSGHDTRLFVPALAELLGDIETVVTANNKEAVLLEDTLVKQHQPRFNVKLRDDKQYLLLRLDTNGRWPRLEVVRKSSRDGAKYFGPYHAAASARHTLRVVNRSFRLRTCSDFVLDHRTRPCLQYQIGRCPAPCVYEVDPEAYAEQVLDVSLFLGGRDRELLENLQTRMHTAASSLEFEVAARLRDQIAAVETSLEHQQVVADRTLDQDVIGLYREGGQIEFAVLHFRRGRLLGSRTHSLRGMELPDADVLHGFLREYYADSPPVADEILLPSALSDDDAEPLIQQLSEARQRRVTLRVPKRGERAELVALANRNAEAAFLSRRDRAEDAAAAQTRMMTRFSLSRLPRRIECFDVSHISGSDAVASMVVFVDGEPEPSHYRHFRIRGGAPTSGEEVQNDDFASMYEALARRLRRSLDPDSPNWALPDLLVIDGGKGQLSRVLAAMDDLGIARGIGGVNVIALAKERTDALGHGREALDRVRAHAQEVGHLGPEAPGNALQDFVADGADGPADQGKTRPERVFLPGARDAIRLRAGSSELHLLVRIRDEAHRVAITHHRKRRSKRALGSVLDTIPGVGKISKRELLRYFGSVAAFREADEAALQQVKGIGPELAQRIRTHLAPDRV